MQVPLFTVRYKKGQDFVGGDLVNPLWRYAPEEPIASFSLKLPSGDFLFLEGYDEYNFFIEALANIYGASGTTLKYMYLMGNKEGIVTSYRIALSPDGHSVGDITTRKFKKGEEYNGKPTTGWK